MRKQIGFIGTISLVSISAVTTAQAADTIKAYTSSLVELDNDEARNKKIRLIYSLENVWNQSSIPDPIKEARLTLNGGSGFDMTNVPNKATTYSYKFGGDYRYTVPTGFKLALGYVGGSSLRHINHAPENTISSATVSDSIEFSLGLNGSVSDKPSIGADAGISWGKRVTYEQKEFETIADFNQSDESINWLIENKTIRNNSPAKNWLLKRWTKCKNNLINYDQLPVVMRSDFKPQVGAVYRKKYINDGEESTNIKLTAAWRKTDYYFGRDWCSWYTDFTWKNRQDREHWTEANRTVSIAWNDNLYN